MSWDDEDFDIPTSNDPVASWEDEGEDDAVLESWDIDEEEVARQKKEAADKKKAEDDARRKKHEETIAKKKAAKSGEKKLLDIDLVDENTRREMLQKAELEADLNNAADLFGGLGVADEHPRARAAREAEASKPQVSLTKETPLSAHPLFEPTNKKEFETLRKELGKTLTPLAEQSSLNYSSVLVIDLVRDLSKPLSIESIRKMVSTLNVIVKEKEREERAARLSKAGGTATGGAGKKKAKAVKANVGGFKKDDSLDTTNYDDDFGDDDFM